MTIRYQLTSEEATGVLLGHRRPRRFVFWLRVSTSILGLALLVGSPHFFRADSVTFLVLAGGCLLTMATALLLAAPWQRRRAFARSVRRYPGFTEPKELSFDERGLVFTSAHARSQIAWTAFSKLAQDGTFIYLYEPGSPLPSVIVPERAFDEASRQEFRPCSADVATGVPSHDS